jgi:hypothetical protein
MMDSAFSSPIIATLADRRQLIVQTRSPAWSLKATLSWRWTNLESYC